MAVVDDKGGVAWTWALGTAARKRERAAPAEVTLLELGKGNLKYCKL